MPDAPASLASRRRPVFISFASEDLDLANRIRAGVEAGGLRCWIAHRDIGVAESYPAAIRAALKASGVLLLVLTGHANRSPHVRREVEMAFNGATPILPIRMSSVLPSPDLEYFLSTTQWLDAGATFDDDEAARLLAVLKDLLDRKTVEHDAWQRLRRRRRTAMAVAGAATLAMTLAIVYSVWRGRSEPPPEGSVPAASSGAAPAPETPLSSPVSSGTSPTRDAVRTAVNPGDGATYVWIPPGEFVMGCSAGDPDCEDDERPAHRVAIERGFWFGQTEVTAVRYNRRPGGPPVEAPDDTVPAAGVTWAEAKAYCVATGGRLPTEAEWEYAARAGTTTRFHGLPSQVAWYEANSDGRPQPVGTKAPNAFGLHDMHGNVAEWVRDRYYNAYDDSGEDVEIPEPLAPNATAVARGGHWASEPRGLRVSRRLEMIPEAADPIFGIRCAHDTL